MDEWLFGFILIIVAASSFITLFLSMLESFDYEDNLLRIAFYCQITVWEDLEGEITATGRVIIIIFISPFILPGNILLMIVLSIRYICIKVWESYKFLFRKRKENHHE